MAEGDIGTLNEWCAVCGAEPNEACRPDGHTRVWGVPLVALSKEQVKLLRAAAHGAVREATGDVWLIDVAPPEGGGDPPMFTVFISEPDDGNRYISCPKELMTAGSQTRRNCDIILAQERRCLIRKKASS